MANDAVYFNCNMIIYRFSVARSPPTFSASSFHQGGHVISRLAAFAQYASQMQIGPQDANWSLCLKNNRLVASQGQFRYGFSTTGCSFAHHYIMGGERSVWRTVMGRSWAEKAHQNWPNLTRSPPPLPLPASSRNNFHVCTCMVDVLPVTGKREKGKARTFL